MPSVASTTAKRTKTKVAVSRSSVARIRFARSDGHHNATMLSTMATDNAALTGIVANISPSMIWMPSDVAAASANHENCSTRSFNGSRISPADTMTPTPAGSNASSVPCATEMTPLSVRVSANVTSAR